MKLTNIKLFRLVIVLLTSCCLIITASAQNQTLRIVTYNIQADTVGIATPGIVSPACGLIEPYEGSGGTYNTNCSVSVINGGVLEGMRRRVGSWRS